MGLHHSPPSQRATDACGGVTRRRHRLILLSDFAVSTHPFVEIIIALARSLLSGHLQLTRAES